MRLRHLSAASVIVGALSAGTLAAQSASPQNYDTSKPVTLTGMVFGLATYGPEAPVYLLLEVQEANGTRKEWAIEGDWSSRDVVKPGQTISIVVYRPKLGSDVATTVPKPEPGRAGERVLDLAKRGRLVRGSEATLPNGTKVVFGEVG